VLFVLALDDQFSFSFTVTDAGHGDSGKTLEFVFCQFVSNHHIQGGPIQSFGLVNGKVRSILFGVVSGEKGWRAS
jgi:hypothetical protein